MSDHGAGAVDPSSKGPGDPRPGDPAGGTGVQHARSFKLRFAAQREPGRSYVSLVKPLGLPATVTGKFYTRGVCDGDGGASERRAQHRIRDLFALGPRERLAAPCTESQRYGWWSGTECAHAQVHTDARLQHGIRDSAWLKARLLVLAADDKLKRN